jgi:phospholipase/lecithinase/hemolysin
MAALIVFGDSLCDTGNARALRGEEAVPCPPHWQGRRCDGPLWVETLAARLGLPPPLPSTAGGSNHACGGARSGSGHSAKGMPNLLEQVEAYARGPQASDSARGQALVVLRAGANDYLDAPPGPAVAEAVNRHLLQAIERLTELGLRRFLLPTELPWGHSPFSLPGFDAAARSALNQLIAWQNADLAARLTALAEQPAGAAAPNANEAVRIAQPDFHGLLLAVWADPGSYGFQEVEKAVLPPEGLATGQPTPSGQGWLWWDSWGHLTTSFHTLLAGEAWRTLERGKA